MPDTSGVSVDDGSAVSRQFVASAPAMSTTVNDLVTGMRKWVFYVAYAVVAAAVFVVTMVRRPLQPWMLWGASGVIVVAAVGPLVWLAYVWLRSRRKTLIDVSTAGLGVNHQPGTTFSVADAQLGSWATMGVALHLRSGTRRFVLGGRDRRVGPAT